jgi:hypothetical protein
MPFGLFDYGVRCRSCGKFINGMAQAFPVMPDPFRVTCPYCGTTASYEKSAIQNDFFGGQKGAKANPAILIVSVIAIVALIAAITRWGG